MTRAAVALVLILAACGAPTVGHSASPAPSPLSGSRGDAGDGGAATRAKLDDPQGIAFGDRGELYFADTGNRRVRVVAPSGPITTII